MTAAVAQVREPEQETAPEKAMVREPVKGPAPVKALERALERRKNRALRWTWLRRRIRPRAPPACR
jgi:hypothetical protein